MVIFMPFAQMIPLSALAAVLIVVAYNMSEWREFSALLKSPKSDVAVLLFTFFITVLADLVVAIGVGMILAALLFMKRMADVSSVKELTFDHLEEDDSFTPSFDDELLQRLPRDIQVYQINGAMFFGAADKFLEVITKVSPGTRVIILRLRNVPAMDATAVHAIKRFIKNCKRLEIKIVLSGLKPQPYETLLKTGLINEIGRENIFELFEQALLFSVSNKGDIVPS
ncbi:MAG: STAS domain-containing protein [Clostridiales bacterium]|nr:STAS domain-containing protein [Clostridiales bacterium]